jgi:hypothetical protein
MEIKGSAVVMQGRYISHQALSAIGATERITMVTSFRPRDPMVRDDSVLAGVLDVSNISELYYQFAEYRMEILEERMRIALKKLRAARGSGQKADAVELKKFLKQQIEFLAWTDREIVEESKLSGKRTERSDINGESFTRNSKRPRVE